MAEGKAVITNIEAPDEFTPGVRFNINVTIRNDGGDDDFFDTIINKDTNEVLSRGGTYILSGTSTTLRHIGFLITQTTDLHVVVEAGHRGIWGIPFVDDAKEFTIPVAVVEGKAGITRLEVPDSFVPGTDVPFAALVKNTGGEDDFFFRIVNRDTGGVICSASFHLRSGRTWEIPALKCHITQTTDFHGRAEAGHET